MTDKIVLARFEGGYRGIYADNLNLVLYILLSTRFQYSGEALF